ncbi:Ulp1 protease family, C-terminal catalytic domain containing protein [Parasponia andersonii]|uniref:Ulp1 protease family, C-terminal catalytic domain containing protein n=1 Tax=Parasponia andersonii TaxID=3476 RepID=A0A2P5BA07_PARAD|nr:Ulp1 protease family, C-terminal catalytic domain containing protein [Parasponia andersonii]
MGRKRKLTKEIVVIDLDSPVAEGKHQLSRHRSCWQHILATLHARKKRLTKKDHEAIDNFKLTAQCFLDFPCRERSTRTLTHKHAGHGVPRLNKKLCSETFGIYFESHWSLLILCNFDESLESETRTPCMLLLDSLESTDPKRLERDIRRFVTGIYKAEGRPETEQNIREIPLLIPQVPQQRNDWECGNFVLYFIKLFMDGAPENFSMEDYPYFMERNWFTPEDLDSFCEGVRSDLLAV